MTIPPGEMEYACRVSIGDEEIVVVEGGGELCFPFSFPAFWYEEC